MKSVRLLLGCGTVATVSDNPRPDGTRSVAVARHLALAAAFAGAVR